MQRAWDPNFPLKALNKTKFLRELKLNGSLEHQAQKLLKLGQPFLPYSTPSVKPRVLSNVHVYISSPVSFLPQWPQGPEQARVLKLCSTDGREQSPSEGLCYPIEI